MTGFARAEGRDGDLAWVWELKSVNGKSLDLRFRLPPGFDHLEPLLRAGAGTVVKRGSLTATLTLTRDPGAGSGFRINREALDAVITVVNELQHVVEAAPPRLDGLLGLRGIIENGAEADDPEIREHRDQALLASWDQVLQSLVATRLAEGERLGASLTERLGEIARLTREAENSAAAQPAAIKLRLKQLVEALLETAPALPEERLAQEAALLVSRADVREELDRLKAHLAAAHDLLKEGKAIGRRFDFLCQEFNREANTLCAKSADVGLTRIGLALKAAIEQLREQVQNIE
jgi:uncharacterized protein (TIGR00255 family)